MDRKNIIKLAREYQFAHYYESGDLVAMPQLERFAALVAAHEREACAAVCCNMIDAEYKTGKVDHNEMAWTQACAIAIRARGEK